MEIREFYNKIAHEYGDVIAHPTTAAARKLEEELTTQIVAGRKYRAIIDIGCGDGSFLSNVKAENKIGIDISIEMIGLNSLHTPQAIYILGQFPNIPLRHNFADLVHASFILDHVGEIGKFLVKTSRLLKHRGQFILAEFNPESVLNFRGREEILRYRSSTGEVYEVQSNFGNLINLERRLRKYFDLQRMLSEDIDMSGIKIDHYLMRKK